MGDSLPILGNAPSPESETAPAGAAAGRAGKVAGGKSPDLAAEAIDAILSTVDLDTVLERTGGLLRRHFGITRVGIHRPVEGCPGVLETVVIHDPRHPGERPGERLPVGGSVAGRAVETGASFFVERLSAERPRHSEEAALAALGYGSVAAFPLRFENEILGALTIAHEPPEGMFCSCFRSGEQISRLVAIALHNALMVEQVRRLNRLLDRENERLREEIRTFRREARYVAESPAMRAVMEKVRLVAAQDATVLVRGETGTGKEGLARAVHEFSPRFEKPFIAVNLAALPETLIESELFGYERGAFTGAQRRQAGRFEQADGGTVFLDEVGDAPPAVQVRLLRVLQEREVQRVGGTAPVKLDVRVIAATNQPLEALVRAGRFREDLYYRLAVFPLALPALRERREDIAPLVRWFVTKHAAAMNRRAPQIPPELLRALEALPWPGNVRELENFVERALILSPGPELRLPDPAGPGRGTSPAPADPPAGWDAACRALLERTLAATGGRIYGPEGAAARLGLKPTTLQGKLKRYGVDAPPRP